MGFPGGSAVKDLPASAGDSRFDLWVGKIPWRMTWQPTSVFLLEDPHGQRSLAGCSPWGHKELDMTLTKTHIHTRASTHTHTHTHLPTQGTVTHCGGHQREGSLGGNGKAELINCKTGHSPTGT